MVKINKSDLLSVHETAFLARVPEKAVWHAISADVVREPGFRRMANAGPRFTPAAVSFFCVLRRLDFDLPKASKRDLFAAVTGGTSKTWRREGSRLVLALDQLRASLEIGEVEKEVDRRVAIYRRGRGERVQTSPEILGGEPVFAGTRIPIRHVGLLVKRGVPENELAEDFPRLSADDREFARMFVEIGPAPGRPRKRLRFERTPPRSRRPQKT